MHYAELSRPASPRPARANVALWAAGIGVGAAAFVVGSALGHADDPLQLRAGRLRRRLRHRRRRHPAALVPGGRPLPSRRLRARRPRHAQRRARPDRDRARRRAGGLGRADASASPSRASCSPSARSRLAYLAASVGASDRGAAAAETLDLVSYAAIVALLMLLLDTPAWLRRAIWAVVAGDRPAGGRSAIFQQVTKTYGSSYGGFAGVLPAGDAMRSAGPLNPNPFGQVLATPPCSPSTSPASRRARSARACAAGASRSRASWAWSTPSRGRR